MTDFALQFDGSQNFVTLGTMGSFGSNLGSGFYASFQVQTTAMAKSECGWSGSYPTQGTVNIAINEDSTGATSSGKIRLYIRDSDGVSGLALSAATTSATNVNDGNVHTIIMTADFTAKVITITLDGVSQALTYGNTDTTTTWANFPFAFYIGATNNQGVVAQAANAIYDNFSIGTSSSVLYGSYSFNEGHGITTADNVGSNPGTLSGSPLPSWISGLSSLNKPGNEYRYGGVGNGMSRSEGWT